MSDDYTYEQAGFDNFLTRSIDGMSQVSLNTPLPTNSLPRVTNREISESTGNILNLGKIQLNGATGIITGTLNSISDIMSSVMMAIYPVGSLYISTLPDNPATLLGIGKWETFGAGKTIISLDSNDVDFDTTGKTGGEKTHTLTVGETASHWHHVTSRINNTTGADGGGPFGIGQGASGGTNYYKLTSEVTDSNPESTNVAVGALPTGGGGAHNNLQPYITVYMWKRIE